MVTTLKDIAKAAGVSVRSVTRALKNEAGGNKKTYEKILRIASDMGYTPNMMARNLRIKKTNIIGMIVSGYTHEVTIKKQIAIHKLLEKEGFSVLSASLPESVDGFDKLMKSWIGLTDTVIILAWGTKFSDQLLLKFPFLFIFVDCMYKEGSAPYIQVRVDRTVGITKAVEYLLRRCKGDIVKVGGKMVDRIKGFENAFKRLGIEVNRQKNFITTGSLEFSDGYNVGVELIKKNAAAVFFDTDRMAFGFLKFANEKRIKIPQQIAVVGFDNDNAGAFSYPALSSVAHPIEEIAKIVVRIIKNRDEFRRRFGPVFSSLVDKNAFLGDNPPEIVYYNPVIFPTEFIRRESV